MIKCRENNRSIRWSRRTEADGETTALLWSSLFMVGYGAHASSKSLIMQFYSVWKKLCVHRLRSVGNQLNVPSTPASYWKKSYTNTSEFDTCSGLNVNDRPLARADLARATATERPLGTHDIFLRMSLCCAGYHHLSIKWHLTSHQTSSPLRFCYFILHFVTSSYSVFFGFVSPSTCSFSHNNWSNCTQSIGLISTFSPVFV